MGSEGYRSTKKCMFCALKPAKICVSMESKTNTCFLGVQNQISEFVPPQLKNNHPPAAVLSWSAVRRSERMGLFFPAWYWWVHFVERCDNIFQPCSSGWVSRTLPNLNLLEQQTKQASRRGWQLLLCRPMFFSFDDIYTQAIQALLPCPFRASASHV